MFKVAPDDRLYDVKVTLDVPLEHGGTKECVFTARFILLPATKLEMLTTDLTYIPAILKGWAGIRAEDGSDYPYSEENVNALAEKPFFAASVAVAYKAFSLGLLEKNSDPRSVIAIGATAVSAKKAPTNSKKTRKRSA